MEVEDLADSYELREPVDVLEWALNCFAPGRVAICTSFQVDGMVVLDMAWRIDPHVRVFTIDTGRLPPETYDLIERVRERYRLEIEVYTPASIDIEELVNQHGPNLFYRSVPLRLACCDVRKVRPLRRVLDTLDAWVTGLRREQSTTRAGIRVLELDEEHPGVVKINPLAKWSEEQVWAYVRANDVPYHPLYDQGYRSIGCAPCTRAVQSGESARAGRWWWEAAARKECGMHCSL
jgi:thioredoxin-dependent adenylylsulfate APS reductase